MIEATGLYKAFGTVKAVDGVGFVARDGEITGLLGPNGAGKTTALRVVYGVLRPDSGHAFVDGIDLAERRLDAQRRLACSPMPRGSTPA